ncbi:MAG: nuclear transport factor 2 family protein [Gammaproteobacteria bacterium]|nr:nuclear transport factor 2 family protein [Gammaproteobacteria bacterium]MDH3413683.1 nuclear transport factor 2 family protein [Gammaproteobacteria bacterium]
MRVTSDASRQKARQEGEDEWVCALFDHIDAMDTNNWVEYLSNDARFCFGNAPPVAGKGAIQDGVNAFFSTLSAVKHDIAETWTPPGAVICRGEVRYTRPDGSTLTIPFANVFKLDGDGLIWEYLIYADTSKL